MKQKIRKKWKNTARFRFWLFVCLAVILVVISLLSPVLMPNDPYETNVLMAKSGPCAEYPLGTDALGRCVLSRVLAGSRTSIFCSVLLVAIMFVFGTGVGVIAGYKGGVLDMVLMRITDFMLSFPQMVVAIVVAGILGGSLLNAMIALGVTGWTGFARVARSRVIAMKKEDYVTAAIISGNGPIRMMTDYVLPNIIGPLIIYAAIQIGTTMLNLAGLSFLGLGVQVPQAEWGSMVNEGRAMIQLAPQVVFAPAAAIFITVVVFNLLGDAARDLADRGSLQEGGR